MADGTIKIDISVDGKQVEVAAKGLDNLGKSGQDSGKGVKGAEDAVKGVGNESEKSSASIKKMAVSLGLVAIAAVAFKVLKDSLDDAITRFDTLNKFPKVLQALGVSAEDAERSMQRLSDGTDGLPTKLDEIASTAQRMYTSFGDMDKATESALALNNALLSQGSSAGEAQRGTDMYLKALQTGKMNMDTWNTLSETMDIGLVKIAEGFGMTKDALYNALKSGEISMDDFNNKMIEVGTGTGELASLAKTNSQGLATSFQNIQTSVSRGLANVIKALDELSSNVTGSSIAENIDKAKVVINAAFKVIVKVIEGATPIVKLFAGAVKAALPVVDALTPAIVGLLAAYAAYEVITKASTAIKASNEVIKVAQAASKTLTLVTAAQITAQMTATGATEADIAAKLAQAATIKLSSFVVGVLTGAISASTAVQIIGTAASYAFGAAIQFLMGPVGWIIAAIGLLVTGVIALVKWFNRSTEEGERLSAETDKLAESTSELTGNIDQNSKSHKDYSKNLKDSTAANKDLVDKVVELSKVENKSAGQREELRQYTNQLNESVSGLGLVYDDEKGKLNLSSEAMKERIDVMALQESANKDMERLTEIMVEQQAIGREGKELVTLQRELNESREDGSITSKEYKEETEKLKGSQDDLITTLDALNIEHAELEITTTAAAETISEAVESGVIAQIESYEKLDEQQKVAFDSIEERYNQLADAATNSFDRINTESKVTKKEILENQQHNLEQTEKYGENMASLYDHAGKNSNDNFIEWLNTLGIDSAAEVAVMASMTDSELDEYVVMFDEQMEAAANASHQSLGEGLEESIDTVIDFVGRTKTTMEQEIKAADFAGIGKDIAEGQAGGIRDGTPEAEKAAKDMAKATEDAARKQSETHSPSRVFERIGRDSTDGLVLGFNNGTNAVIISAKQLSMATISQYKNMPSAFRGIGINAMSGLNAGLHAGSGRVMSTARNLANRVAATMRSALKIHSPSRLMRDDIGKMIPEGIAVGIEANESSVFNALKNTANKMVDFARPEQAIGGLAFAGGGAGGGSDVLNNNNTANSTSNITINYHGSGDVEEDAEHIADMVDKEFAKRKGFNSFFKGGK